MTNFRVVLCTCPDEQTAGRIAADLLERRLAACVNIVGPIRSVFLWEGRVSDESEMLLIAKTTSAALRAMEERLSEIHPYDVPEFIALPVSEGATGYLDWLGDSVTGAE